MHDMISASHDDAFIYFTEDLSLLVVWCLGRATVYNCGTPWTFLLPFFYNTSIILSTLIMWATHFLSLFKQKHLSIWYIPR